MTLLMYVVLNIVFFHMIYRIDLKKAVIMFLHVNGVTDRTEKNLIYAQNNFHQGHMLNKLIFKKDVNRIQF